MEKEEKPEVFKFPIGETNDQERMNNTNLASLLNFYGLTTEDPYAFLF